MTAYPRPGVLHNYVMEMFDWLFHLFTVYFPFSRQFVICALLEIKTDTYNAQLCTKRICGGI